MHEDVKLAVGMILDRGGARLTISRIVGSALNFVGDKRAYPCETLRAQIATGEIRIVGHANDGATDAPAAPPAPRNLADECGALATEIAVLKIENSDLRREIERMKRRAR